MNTTFAAELKIKCIVEKRNKTYRWYGVESIADEHWIWSLQASGLQAALESRLAGA